MLVELNGKGGKVCEYAKQGVLRCPLIVRPTSEDQITGETFQVLQAINPRHWLPQLLNRAVGEQRFKQQVFRKMKIELWSNQPCYPRHLLPWNEGSTQVDVVITWENPPTTIFMEMKFGAGLSSTTVDGRGRDDYPSDQLIRNIRVGLWRTGWIQEPTLFKQDVRDFAVIVVSPNGGMELVQTYRRTERLLESIPFRKKLKGLPRQPFVGEVDYAQIVETMRDAGKWVTWQERLLIDDLCSYLEHKLKQKNALGKTSGRRQRRLKTL